MKRILGAMTVLCALTLWTGAALADGDGAWVADVATDDLNLGSGTQTNANDWKDMFDVNVDGNQLTGGGINSNGGDRSSDDVVILSGTTPEVANYALDASVSDNSISVSGSGSNADSTVSFSGNSGFTNSYGITAVAVNSGAGASQSVSVNVMSSLSVGAAE